MARSSPEECARLSTLNDFEEFILFRLAYGYAPAWIDRELAARPELRDVTVDVTVAVICDKLLISGDIRGSERLRRAGKIYMDAKEIERERDYRERPEVYGAYEGGTL